MLVCIVRGTLRVPLSLKTYLQRIYLACAYLVVINLNSSMYYSVNSPRSKYLADCVSGCPRRNDGFLIRDTQNIFKIKTMWSKDSPLPLCTKILKAFSLWRLCTKCAYSFLRGKKSFWVINSMRRKDTKKGKGITEEDVIRLCSYVAD